MKYLSLDLALFLLLKSPILVHIKSDHDVTNYCRS